MAQHISSRVRNLSPSATLEMSRKSGELKAQGIDVINLSIGEPDFNTPQAIKDAAVQALENNVTKYSPVPGFAPLRQAIADKLLHENNLHYLPEEIMVSSGAKQSICNALLTLVDEGDEVIIPAPYWVSYPQMVKIAGGKPVFVDAPIEQDFKITPAQLEAAITPKTRLMILCSPSNPSGAVYSAQELEGLAKVVLSHEDLLVLSDEIYEHINYTGAHASIAAVPGMRERTVIINGVSKAYAMTGWRIGFIAGPKWIVSACNTLQGQYTGGPCSISQKAAQAAWSGSQDCVEQMRQAFQRRRDLTVRLIKEIPGLVANEPQGAFYLLPKCSSFYGKSDGSRVINSSSDLAMYLLEEAHVAIVGGESFGAPDCFRISYAASEEEIKEAAARIKAALAKLK